MCCPGDCGTCLVNGARVTSQAAGSVPWAVNAPAGKGLSTKLQGTRLLALENKEQPLLSLAVETDTVTNLVFRVCLCSAHRGDVTGQTGLARAELGLKGHRFLWGGMGGVPSSVRKHLAVFNH